MIKDKQKLIVLLYDTLNDLKVEGEKTLNIAKAKLRGVESFGMLCSSKELGLSEDGKHIISFPLCSI